MTHLSEQKLKIAGASPTLRTKIVFEEEIFTAVAGISILSGMSKIGLGPIARTISTFIFPCYVTVHYCNIILSSPITGTAKISALLIKSTRYS